MKKEIQLDLTNIQQCVENVVGALQIVSNKKKKSKKAESYLYCGGGYDTESTTILNADGKPLFAFVYHVQIMINGFYLYARELDIIVPFFQSLIEHIKSQYENAHLIIWVANLAHEWAFAKRQFADIGITEIFAKTERNPLKITLNNCIEFRECIGLFGRSLAHIAETYTTTQKLDGDLDYKLIRLPNVTTMTENEKNYCYNDVKILDELSLIALDKFTKNGLKMPLTSTGILRQQCKNLINNIHFEYLANEQLMPETEQEYYETRKYLYNGGLCGSNIDYIDKPLNGVKCADITSDYPAQLNHNMFPSGKLVECKPDEIIRYKSKFRFYIIHVEKMEALTKHCVFSKYKIMNPNSTKNALYNNGKIYFIENVQIMVSNTDMQALMKLYKFTGVKILKSWYFTAKSRAPKFLLKLMNDYYLKKCELKEKGLDETVEYKEAKAFVNSFYGMCATSIYADICEYDETARDIKKKSSDKPYEEQRRKMWLNPFIAYWCTSYARQILIDLIAKYPELIVQYDTDSIYYITDEKIVKRVRVIELENDLLKYNQRKRAQNAAMFAGNEHFYTLGTWDIEEKPYKRFKCLGAKRYLKEKQNGELVPVVAGLPKRDFIGYVQNKKINPFDFFHFDMILDKINCNKLASAYYDGEPKYYHLTDYQGHSDIVKISTYHALFNIEFTLKDISNLISVQQYLKEQQNLPVRYRDKITESEEFLCDIMT